MGSPETLSSHPERYERSVHRSVRVFCVAPIQVSDLETALSSGIPIDNLRLVDVVLARKNDTSLVTALGGEIHPGEDLLRASGRKVFEESLLTRESQRKLEASVGSGMPIPYVRTDTGERCEAFLTVMPVRSATISIHEPRERGASGDSIYKISELVHVSPEELDTLFTSGEVETRIGGKFQMFGHLTQAPVADVVLTPEARLIQQKEFTRVLHDVISYENELKNMMLIEVNRIRHLHHNPQITSLGECGNNELIKGYLLAKWVMGMADNTIRESNNDTRPAPATDLPVSALFLREFPPEELSDALMAAPTKEVRRARNAVFHALDKTVSVLYEHMGLDFRTMKVGEKEKTRPMDTIAALRYIWPDVLEKSPEALTTLLSQLDQVFISELGNHLHISEAILRRAIALPSELPPYIAGEIRNVKKDTFQEHYPPNEVASAAERPFVQMLYIFGLHPYRNVSAYAENEAMKRIRGGVLMQLAITFSALPSVEQQVAADNSLFEKVLADFMQLPPELDRFNLGRTSHTVHSRRTEDDIDGKPLELWHDKRLVKSIIRLWVKSLQESNIYDMFSHNFVIRDTNFSDTDRYNIALRLHKSEAFRDALLAHCRRELSGDGWEVSIVEGTHKTGVIDTARKVLYARKSKDRKKLVAATEYRKRSGSIAHTILREKFVLSFTKKGKSHFTEICIYPFERVRMGSSQLSGSGLMGFVEKLLDDKSGRYNGYRLIKTDETDPTAPAVLEIIEPPVWQRSAYDDIWELQHTPGKK